MQQEKGPLFDKLHLFLTSLKSSGSAFSEGTLVLVSGSACMQIMAGLCDGECELALMRRGLPSETSGRCDW